MNTATISAKYQVVIPFEIRKELNVKPGQKLFFVRTSSGIQIIPQIPLTELFGIFKGIDTTFEREDEDRL